MIVATARNQPRVLSTVTPPPIPVAGKRPSRAKRRPVAAADSPPPDLDERERQQSSKRRIVGSAATRDIADATDDRLPDVAPSDPS